MQTAAPLDSGTLAFAPCPSSERQAAPLEQDEKQATTTRPKTRRREQGSKTKFCCFCLTDIPIAAARCQHCTSVLNHAECMEMQGQQAQRQGESTNRRSTANSGWASGPIHGQEQ